MRKIHLNFLGGKMSMIRNKPKNIPYNEYNRYYGRNRDLRPMDVNFDLNWEGCDNDGTVYRYA